MNISRDPTFLLYSAANLIACPESDARRRRSGTMPDLTEQEMEMQARALSLASLETFDCPDRLEGVSTFRWLPLALSSLSFSQHDENQ